MYWVGGGDVGYVLGGWRRCRLCITERVRVHVRCELLK